MDQRIYLITLGVADLAASRRRVAIDPIE